MSSSIQGKLNQLAKELRDTQQEIGQQQQDSVELRSRIEELEKQNKQNQALLSDLQNQSRSKKSISFPSTEKSPDAAYGIMRQVYLNYQQACLDYYKKGVEKQREKKPS